MEKRGDTAIIVVIILVVLFFAGSFVWKFVINKLNTEQEINKTSEDRVILSVNETIDIEINKTNENTEANKMNITLEEEKPKEIISLMPTNPTGSIKFIDHRNDETGGYFCNETEKPSHRIKLYTYKIINGDKNLSEEFIESSKIDDICSSYASIDMNLGIKYDIEWIWTPVTGINGYRVYQYYYLNENTSRNYDYYLDLSAKRDRFWDTGLKMWIHEIKTNLLS